MAISPSPRSSAQRRLWVGLGAGAVVVLCLCLVVGIGGGVALYLTRNQTSAVAAIVEYVLDASPRMAQPGDTGAPRLTVARGVLADIVRPADPAVVSGLRLFGSGAVAQSCQDTNLLVPLGPSSARQIADSVAGLEAGQSTDSALAEAIVAAIRDLASKKGTHSLVVVTGGSDSCNPNAGQVVAQEAKRSGIDLETYVVGFGVSDTEAQAIKVVLNQTPKARYLAAKDEATLRTTLRGVQDRIEHPAAGYTGQNACDYPYNPLRIGATWEYSDPYSTYSQTVTAATGGPSQTTVTEASTSAYSGGSANQTYDTTCGPDGIEGFQMQFGGAGQGTTGKMTMTAHSGHSLVPPSEMAPGTTWSDAVTWVDVVTQADKVVTMTMDVTDTYTAVGVESVTTPAGTFSAIRVDTVSTSLTTNPSLPAGSQVMTYTSAMTTWYARGVGMVKWASAGGGTPYESQLVAYSVPGFGSGGTFQPPSALAPAGPTPTAAPTLLLNMIPVYPGSTIDQQSGSVQEHHVQITFRTGDTLNQVEQFYVQALQGQGWSQDYALVRISGGPYQTWVKDAYRLDLDYSPADTGQPAATVVRADLQELDLAGAAAVLPPALPLPDGAVILTYDGTDLTVFVPQDYAAVVAFYKGKLAALTGQGWKEGTPPPPMEGSCGGDCTQAQPNWPAGTTPEPLPTVDPRGNTTLLWIAPNKDEYLIQIDPQGSDTRLSVKITLKDPADAHLPADVPIYQGAVIQMVTPGNLSFEAGASVDTVTKFYDDALTAAGWQKEASQAILMWKKGSQEISVTIVQASDNKSSVNIFCIGCTTP
jgi:hypothetical protein